MVLLLDNFGAHIKHRLRDVTGQFGPKEWMKLICQPQKIEIAGAGTVIDRKYSVLDAAMTPHNCRRAFEMCGITLDDAQQYHPEWLDTKFDAEDILKPCAFRLAVCHQCVLAGCVDVTACILCATRV